MFDLFERYHHEVSLIHQWMGNLEVGRFDMQLVEKQDIDIDGTVTIAFALVVTPEFPFYLLGDLEHLPWQECRLAVDGTIEELVT